MLAIATSFVYCLANEYINLKFGVILWQLLLVAIKINNYYKVFFCANCVLLLI